MVVEPLLRGLVVVRRHGQYSVRAHPLGLSRHFDDVMCVIAAGAGQDGNFALGFFQRDRYDAQMFFLGQRGAFARGAAGHEKINPRFDLAAD